MNQTIKSENSSRDGVRWSLGLLILDTNSLACVGSTPVFSSGAGLVDS